MKKKYKYTLLFVSSIPILFGIKEYWRMNIGGFAGSYPFVETYEFEVSESELLKIIESLKSDNPELRAKHDSIKKHSYWTFVTFYYPDTDEYVNTWVRSSFDKELTTLAFIGLTPSQNIYAGKKINADYFYFDNRKQIKKFEEKIVKPIRERVKNGLQHHAADKPSDNESEH